MELSIKENTRISYPGWSVSMKPDDDYFLFEMPETASMIGCVILAALLAIFGIVLGLYEVVRALFGEWV